MLHLVLLVHLLICGWGQVESKKKKEESDGDSDFGAALITSMRNDANLDLPVDEEYEDLRAELLAYHTALASLTAAESRRSMGSTSCWGLGGICIDQKLCTSQRYLAEISGCKDKFKVCCFGWNKYEVRDYKKIGLDNIALPWKSIREDFGGEGIREIEPQKNRLKKKHNKGSEDKKSIALIIRGNK